MKDHIQVVLTFTFPMDKLTPFEQREWRKEFEELQHEISETCPEGVTTTLVVSVIEK